MAQLLPRFTTDETPQRVQKAVQGGEGVKAGPGTAGGDWRHLRGLPMIGRFTVGGAMFGSRPEREVLKLDRRNF